MTRQHRDDNVDGPVSPYGDHTGAIVAMTCKIRDGITLPRPISLRRRISHCHGATQEPRCLSDERRLNRLVVAFRPRVEYQQVLHDHLSPHHCCGVHEGARDISLLPWRPHPRYTCLSEHVKLHVTTFIHNLLMFLARITDLTSMSPPLFD